jgi:hypothetical protein
VRTPYNSNKGAMFTDWNQIAWTSDITNLQNVVNGKANSTDVSNLQSMITGLSTKVDSAVAKLQGQITEIQQNSLKIVPITQTDYDALSTKDPNTIYAIGG